MKSKLLQVLAVVLFASTGTYALATPINTNVTFPGRSTLCIGNSNISVSAGPLDVGTNTITGSTYYSGVTGSTTCLFDLTVSNPLVLDVTEVRFDVTNVVGFADVIESFFGPGVDTYFYRDSPSTWSFDSGPIFLTGLNSLFYDTQSTSATGLHGPYDFLFTLQIDAVARDVTPVTPVPEPITLSFFGTGLAGAIAIRRRKKAA